MEHPARDAAAQDAAAQDAAAQHEGPGRGGGAGGAEPTIVVEIAEEIAGQTLLPAASATDRAELLPRANLDVLAEAGLYGLFGPVELGGWAADLVTAAAVVERVASGCLTTTLVWLQHHGIVGNLVAGAAPLRDEWLADLCSGRRRSGIVFTGLLPGPSSLTAVPADDGWILRGRAPWVSGWGRIDTLQVAARGPGDTVVTVALGDLSHPGLTAQRHHLAVLDASGTVQLHFDDVRVDAGHVLGVAPHRPGETNALSLRLNGSLALGVARRCCRLIGPSALDDQLDEVRSRLDTACDDDIAEARAAASAFAHKAATTLLVHTGSRSIELDDNAQRLAREAMFLMVFGSRPAIRSALLQMI